VVTISKLQKYNHIEIKTQDKKDNTTLTT